MATPKRTKTVHIVPAKLATPIVKASKSPSTFPFIPGSKERPITLQTPAPSSKAVSTSTVTPGSESTAYPMNQHEMALCITILRSKPPEATVKEYLEKIRKYIRLTRPTPVEKRRCVDTVEFWKDEFVWMREQKLKLEQEVAKLRLQQGERIDLYKPIYDEDILAVAETRKRKAAEMDPNLYPSLDVSSPTAAVKTPNIHYLPLVEQFYILRRHVSNPSVAASVLFTAMLSTIKAIYPVITQLANMDTLNLSHTTCSHIFNSAAASTSMLFEALVHLCRDISGRGHKGKMVYFLCKLFWVLIEQHKLLCETVATLMLKEDPQLCDPKTAKTLIVPTVLRTFGRLLTSILTNFWFHGTKPHSALTEVFEGFCAVFVNRLAALLSHTVFGEVVAESGNPGHITAVDPKSPVDEAETLALRMERHQMTQILRHIINSQNSTMQNANILLASNSASKSSSDNAAPAPLTNIARRRLQETLCRAVFADRMDEFAKALKVPSWDAKWEAEDEIEIPPCVREVGEDDRFIEAVWEVVGWDILADEDERNVEKGEDIERGASAASFSKVFA